MMSEDKTRTEDFPKTPQFHFWGLKLRLVRMRKKKNNKEIMAPAQALRETEISKSRKYEVESMKTRGSFQSLMTDD